MNRSQLQLQILYDWLHASLADAAGPMPDAKTRPAKTRLANVTAAEAWLPRCGMINLLGFEPSSRGSMDRPVSVPHAHRGNRDVLPVTPESGFAGACSARECRRAEELTGQNLPKHPVRSIELRIFDHGLTAEDKAMPKHLPCTRQVISGFVQMLWGERRGHGTFGAVQPLPMEALTVGFEADHGTSPRSAKPQAAEMRH
jgi:hypothetical protein